MNALSDSQKLLNCLHDALYYYVIMNAICPSTSNAVFYSLSYIISVSVFRSIPLEDMNIFCVDLSLTSAFKLLQFLEIDERKKRKVNNMHSNAEKPGKY